MKVASISPVSDEDRYRRERYGERCPRATPFQAPQWVIPWVPHVFGGGRILGLAFRDAGELVGLAPLFVWGKDRRTVSFLGAGISDYGDFLFAAGCEDECASAVRSFLEQRAGWDAIDLQEVPSGSALLGQWPSVRCSVCPTLDLKTFPECMDRKHRTDVRRALNKLSREPGFELSLVQDLERVFPVARRPVGGDLGERLRGFHCEVAEAFRVSGHLRSFVLRTANGAAAAIYGFARGSTLYCYLSGFDPSMARLSPGAVLLGWAIEQSIADGLEEIDFLRKPEPYKYLWGARDQVNFAVKSF